MPVQRRVQINQSVRTSVTNVPHRSGPWEHYKAPPKLIADIRSVPHRIVPLNDLTKTVPS